MRRSEPTPDEVSDWSSRYDAAGSVSELARRLNKSPATIRYHLRRCGVEIRSTGFASPKSVTYSGTEHSNWKGGTYRHSDGYIYQYAPEHPNAGIAKGYVLQHRLVMEQVLGRLLTATELVHHVNGVKDDNRPDNLVVEDWSSHGTLHKTNALRDSRGRFTRVT